VNPAVDQYMFMVSELEGEDQFIEIKNENEDYEITDVDFEKH